MLNKSDRKNAVYYHSYLGSKAHTIVIIKGDDTEVESKILVKGHKVQLGKILSLNSFSQY